MGDPAEILYRVPLVNLLGWRYFPAPVLRSYHPVAGTQLPTDTKLSLCMIEQELKIRESWKEAMSELLKVRTLESAYES